MTDEKAEKPPAINWVQVIAGSLAAVSSAVLLSTLGVAGTLVGAALGSVVASVASSVYSRGIQASGQQVQAVALRRVSNARSQFDAAVSAMDRGETGAQMRVRAAEEELGQAEQALQQAQGAGTGAPEAPDAPVAAPREARTPRIGWRERMAGLPWKRVAVVAAGVFVVAMVSITAFELSTGRAVSEYTGGSDRERGTTIPGLRDSGEPEPEPTESPTGEPTGTPSDSPTDGPTDSPTEAPTESPTEEPTAAPTQPVPSQPVPSPEATVGAPAPGAEATVGAPAPEVEATVGPPAPEVQRAQQAPAG